MHRWLVWNILFPLQEQIKGHPTFRILKEMEAAERLDRDACEALRASKLRRLLTYAQANVPYIREQFQRAGISVRDIQSPADLVRLPVMRKADVREHRATLRSIRAGRVATMATGGSSGEPLYFDLPKERIASWIACRQRVMRWWNLSAGDREFAIWGSPVELKRQDHVRAIRDRLFGTRLLSAFEMSDRVMSHYLDLLIARGCRTIFSYPSSLYLLCLHARNQRRDLRRIGIRAAFVTGEVLLSAHRELISETLGCPVANGYGGRESGFIAHECPRGGMHIMADATIVETLDANGAPVPEGVPGEIVITDLYSREVPFIRYATGDMAVLSRQACPCGKPLPLIERLEGRTTDFVVGPDGRILHALSVIYILREIEGISQFKVHQTALDRFHLQIVRNGRYGAESETRIRRQFRERLRAPIEITLEYLPSLPAERSGKFRYVVSDLSPVKDQCSMVSRQEE